MTRLKLGVVESDKPVSVTVRFPPALYRDLEAYAEDHAEETKQPKLDIKKLIVPIVSHFLTTDRAFSVTQKRKAKSAVERKS